MHRTAYPPHPELEFRTITSPVRGQPDMVLVESRGSLDPGIYGLQLWSESPRWVFPAGRMAIFRVGFMGTLQSEKCEDWLEMDRPWPESSKVDLKQFPCNQSTVPERWTGQRPPGYTGDPRYNPPSQVASRPPAGTSAPPSGVSTMSPQARKDAIARVMAEEQKRIGGLPFVKRVTVSRKTNVGRGLMDKEDWERARQEFLGVLYEDPQNLEAMVNLSGVYAMLKNMDQAKKYYEMAMGRAPFLQVPLVNMVYACARSGNAEEAVKYLDMVVASGWEDLARFKTDKDLPQEFREHPKVQQLASRGG